VIKVAKPRSVAVDFLRAVAVVAVILRHFHLARLPLLSQVGWQE
jgi:peptidoglycan/LPS O-acetylase OafA/YrhL